MKLGLNPAVALYKDGYISGISSGSDAYAEHEVGVKNLMQKFCGDFLDLDARVDCYRSTGEHTIVQVKDSKTLSKNLYTLTRGSHKGAYWFSTVTESVAVGYIDRYSYLQSSDQKLQSCWDSDNFIFWSWDTKFSVKLQEFFGSIKAGHTAFFTREAPMWKNKDTSGIHLVDLTRLSYPDACVFNVLQEKQEAETVLYAASNAAFIQEEHKRQFGDFWFGFLRPDRFAEDGKTVLYFLNPSYGTKANYIGPYTEAQLLKWIRAGKNYQLTPSSPE